MFTRLYPSLHETTAAVQESLVSRREYPHLPGKYCNPKRLVGWKREGRATSMPNTQGGAEETSQAHDSPAPTDQRSAGRPGRGGRPTPRLAMSRPGFGVDGEVR